MPRANTGNSATAGYAVSQLDQNHSLLSPLFADETSKTVQEQLYHLVTLVLPDGLDPLYLVDSNYDVKYPGGEFDPLYKKFPLKFSPPSISSDGSIDKSSIVIANVSQNTELQYSMLGLVEAYGGLKNCRVEVKTIYANALPFLYSVDPENGSIVETPNPTGGDPAAHLSDQYLVDNYSMNEQAISFTLEPILDLEIKLPRRRYVVDACYWRFREATTCKYVTGFTAMFKFTDGSTQVTVSNLPEGITLVPGMTFSYLDHWTLTVTTVASQSSVTVSMVPWFSRDLLVVSNSLTLPTCSKNFDDCRKHGIESNFGGMPGISGSRRIFL